MNKIDLANSEVTEVRDVIRTFWCQNFFSWDFLWRSSSIMLL